MSAGCWGTPRASTAVGRPGWWSVVGDDLGVYDAASSPGGYRLCNQQCSSPPRNSPSTASSSFLNYHFPSNHKELVPREYCVISLASYSCHSFSQLITQNTSSPLSFTFFTQNFPNFPYVFQNTFPLSLSICFNNDVFLHCQNTQHCRRRLRCPLYPDCPLCHHSHRHHLPRPDPIDSTAMPSSSVLLAAVLIPVCSNSVCPYLLRRDRDDDDSISRDFPLL